MPDLANQFMSRIKQQVLSPRRVQPQISARQRMLLRVLALLLFLAITATLLLMRDQLHDLGRLGYAGAFFVNLASSATIVLPAPGLAVTFALGATLPSPLLVGLTAGLGATLGEITGYLAGYSGRAIVEDRERYERLADFMRRRGTIVIFVFAALPVPAFDLAGIAAGTLKVPVSTFLLACWPGKTLKTLVVAFAGAGMLPRLAEWITQLIR